MYMNMYLLRHRCKYTTSCSFEADHELVLGIVHETRLTSKTVVNVSSPKAKDMATTQKNMVWFTRPRKHTVQEVVTALGWPLQNEKGAFLKDDGCNTCTMETVYT